jgi:2-oxoisovalerate dehydrogenase E1 component
VTLLDTQRGQALASEVPLLSEDVLRRAILIREVESALLDLFSQGRLHGTVHTCVGQEFSALAFAGQLEQGDFVFSNHRCHGHYLAMHDDCEGLIAELMGKVTGMCGGVGGSQHLCGKQFFSNGVQGGITPVAAGMALAEKLGGSQRIVVVYIGDGTLGEGVVYETLNIVSRWGVPLLIVCEDNQYAQSTSRDRALAGEILQRAGAFAIRTFRGTTARPDELLALGRQAIECVRSECRPAFFLVDTYRLNAHSKGDDTRDPGEVERYRDADAINTLARNDPDRHAAWRAESRARVQRAIAAADNAPELRIDQYVAPVSALSESVGTVWRPLPAIDQRQAKLINVFFHDAMASNEKVVFMGEDVLSPYGGAFKVSQGLSDQFADRVFTTPISEAAITGLANGLALRGFKPFVEIMFGDFVTLALDQILNHAAKFFYMYNRQVTCPIVLRTPMGGRRGYGPTHSQTLDKHLLGIDGARVIALNQMLSPHLAYQEALKSQHPVIVLENKSDYARKVGTRRSLNFKYEYSSAALPTVRIAPAGVTPNATLVAYGGAVEPVLDALDSLFEDLELLPEVMIPTLIHPLDFEPILNSVRKTRRLFVVEEASVAGGFGSEVVSRLVEALGGAFLARRIGALPVPIPACKGLERSVLPEATRILEEIRNTLQ